ncbi:7-cyano-7-deazaguanine reductase [Tamilnaduibacter salinus]|uniref:NADPH-dependent 7-cyano-7-deazaguanine reductase n=1 Tax=Tamilnaduibacter salinus TaxID=1484056 RepID=A0A2A2I1P7_9GAMM|nr:NADPH-dependent 7-cyano-7-deazaguanine reductase QueF [Tamilnaduibacter salinus]PAV25236.1 NADPH-dependent 7-cyano-7-deazaguanine reductase QueF [Tamilnaduibacter salinus]PVY75299.1 7-cyano-7-deazaguanine reductase [Tamilnaduibacter salinus]
MSLNDAPLGQTSDYPEQYAPERLYPVPRAANRKRLALSEGHWPWFGADIWQAWELSWLRSDGIPAVAWARFTVPADSPFLIESKSLKLYLNSLNQERFESAAAVRHCIERDMSQVAGKAVGVQLYSVDDATTAAGRPDNTILIDDAPITTHTPENPTAGERRVTERLCSHLLKSNCPVTGQPDWATVVVAYTGREIERASLLNYLVGFRQKQDFHEHCVETIFTDLMKHCRPEALSVLAQYTRRGGLDINPWRSTADRAPAFQRLVRQ